MTVEPKKKAKGIKGKFVSGVKFVSSSNACGGKLQGSFAALWLSVLVLVGGQSWAGQNHS